jgi:3-hydroxyisobutyrate dehydrogenase
MRGTRRDREASVSGKLRVGVIGVGAMGMAVARNLLARGYSVRVRDIRPEAEAEAAAAGAIACESPAALASACDVVISLVVDQRDTEAIVFGADGLAGSLAPDAVYVMSSTVPPSYASDLGARLGARGLAMLDAPVSGGPARAREGTLSMMIAGSAAARRRAEPVLADVGTKRFVVGDTPGDGSKAKIVNNLLAGVNLAAAGEAMTLALKLGLDPKLVLEIVSASSGASWIFGDRMPRVVAGDYAPRAATKILTKDLSIAAAAAAEAGVPGPLATAARDVFAAAVADGHGEADDAAVIRYYAARAGVKLPTKD